jgi:hypothetical protein
MNPTKDTKSPDFSVDSERFGEEASMEDRSEEEGADLRKSK